MSRRQGITTIYKLRKVQERDERQNERDHQRKIDELELKKDQK